MNNYLNMPRIDQQRGLVQRNAMNMANEQEDRALYEDAMSEQQRIENTQWMAEIGRYGQQQMSQDPNSYLKLMPMIEEEGKRRGMWEKISIDYTTAAPEEILKGFQNMEQQAQLGLAGMEQQQPEHTKDAAGYNRYTSGSQTGERMFPGVVAKEPAQRRPSSARQNYEMREQLVAEHGEGSQQVKVFDNYVRAAKIVDIGSVPTEVSASAVTSLSTLETETSGVQAIQSAKEQAITDAVVPRGEKERIVKLTASAPATYRSVKYAVSELDRFADQAKQVRDHPGLKNATGFGGKQLSAIPGTEAANAVALLETLKAKAFISALGAMRASSKTGGAVGNVSDAEGGRFENAFVALSQAQSYEQFIEELDRLIALTEESEYLLTSAYNDEYGEIETAQKFEVGASNVGTPNNEVILQQAREAIAAGKDRASVIEMLQMIGIDPGNL